MQRAFQTPGDNRTAFVCLRQETNILKNIRDFVDPFKGRIPTGFACKTLRLHEPQTAAYSVALHEKYTLMATVGADRETHIVDTRSWKKVASLPFGYRSVAFHHRLPLLAVGGDDNAAVYDLSHGCSGGSKSPHTVLVATNTLRTLFSSSARPIFFVSGRVGGSFFIAWEAIGRGSVRSTTPKD